MYKFSKYITILVAVYTGICSCQTKKFSIKELKHTSIEFNDISLGKNVKIYNDSILMNEDTLGDAKLFSIKLSNKEKIVHQCYNLISDKDEYLIYHDKKINIDSLFKKNVNNYNLDSKTSIMFVGDIVKFSYMHDDYVLLGARDRRFIRNTETNYWILLQTNNINKIINSYSFVDNFLDGVSCFGDYNQDGNLDYLNVLELQNKVRFYTAKEKIFVEEKIYYLIINPSKEQNQMLDDDNVGFIYDSLNKKESKWFYKL